MKVSSLVVSFASYTMLFVRHFPSSGHCVAFLQLQERSFAGGGGVMCFFSKLTLCFVMIDLMFSIQE